jgi:hypothetical protein
MHQTMQIKTNPMYNQYQIKGATFGTVVAYGWTLVIGALQHFHTPPRSMGLNQYRGRLYIQAMSFGFNWTTAKAKSLADQMKLLLAHRISNS